MRKGKKYVRYNIMTILLDVIENIDSCFRYRCYIPERHLPCTYGVSRIFPM